MSISASRNWLLGMTISVATIACCSLITGVVTTSAAGARSTLTSPSALSNPNSSPPASAPADSTATPSPTATPSATPPAPVPAAAPRQVLTIGDSIMKGFGLTPADAWPELISAANSWDLTNLACDGAGFLAAGNPDECGVTLVDVSQSVTALHPDLVIIQGSSNDFGESNSQLLAATGSAFTILRSEFPNAEIIGLSTVWSETVPPAQLADINSQVKQAVTAVGGHYLDIGQPLGGHPELMQDDDVHPTVAGQTVIAGAIRAAILTEQHATALQKKQQQENERELKMMARWAA